MHFPQDRFTFWVFSGIIGVIARDIWSYFARQVGLTGFYIWNLGASLMVQTALIETFWGTILGFLVDIVIGSMFGVMIGILLHLTGRAYYILKGIGVGLIAWMFFYGILYHNLPFTQAYAPGEPLSNIGAFIGHSIFGAVAVLVYVKLFAKNFESETVTKSEDAKVNNIYSGEYKLNSEPLKNIERKIRAIKPKKIK